ncbi:universal stress protein [Geminicoccus harenae]|uniref:universal stress protein n=1 Tax=Geminicoccus harenae TaxID=2498453 RepID=UPI00168B79FA|nr:universal stress protein [Geminicoccus harenae]
MPSKILALIDGSIYAQSVCDLAAWAAKRSGLPVEVVHMLGRRDTSSTPADLSGSLNIDESETLLSELARLDEQKARLAHQRGRLILDGAATRLREAGVPGVTSKLRNGDLIEAVQELEVDAAYVVIGKRGEAADFARLHLGSNLERVARSARKPVLVAARAFKPIRRVMIAFDGGTSVRKAIAHIAHGDHFRGLPLHLLMAGADNRENQDQLGQASGYLRSGGHEATTQILPGEPETVIAREVQEQGIDLLVMGAYGHTRLRNLIIGSTTTEMIRSCKVPILLFR